MLKKATTEDLDELLQFTEDLLAEGLYVYLNLRNYGIDDPNVNFWPIRDEETRGIVGIIMQYYGSGVTVMSRNDGLVLSYLLEFAAEAKPMSLMGRLDLIEKVHAQLTVPYTLKKGWVYNLSNYRLFDTDIKILSPTRDEMIEIAEFLFAEEDTRSHYPNPEALAKQLTERYDNNTGSNFIIRENGAIIAHIGSYAKGHGIGTTAGLYIDEDHRDVPYGTFLESHLVQSLKDEGLKPYTFIYNPRRAMLLNAVGTEMCCEHGILTRTE